MLQFWLHWPQRCHYDNYQAAPKARPTVEVNSSHHVPNRFYLHVPPCKTNNGNGEIMVNALRWWFGRWNRRGGWIWGPKLNQQTPSFQWLWETTQFNSPAWSNTGKSRRCRCHLFQEVKITFRIFPDGYNIDQQRYGEQRKWKRKREDVRIQQLSTRHCAQHTVEQHIVCCWYGYKFSEKLKSDASITYNRQYTDNFLRNRLWSYQLPIQLSVVDWGRCWY